MEATYSEKVHQRISAVSKNVRQHLYLKKQTEQKCNIQKELKRPEF